MRSIFTGAKKCGGAKHHKGRSPTGVLRSLAAYWRRTVTDLLSAGLAPLVLFYHIFNHIKRE